MAVRLASLAECYSNHITTRICIQTAGLAFGGTGLCSCRVRGVDGSCAEHLTVESYTVVICQQSYLLLSVFRHPLTLSFQAKTSLFCKSFPPQPFLFFFRIHYMDSPRLLLLSIFRLLLFSFSVSTIFSCRFRAVD